MSKFCIRILTLLISLYMVLCYLLNLLYGINIWSHTYTVLFEICVCLCISAQGVYHCKYIKWTAYGLTISDTIVSFDEIFDVFSYTIVTFIPLILTIIGLATTTILAIRHFVRVRKINRKWEQKQKRNPLS